MTINFDTLKVSLILDGLNALYAIILLAAGWYLSGAMQRFVTRVLNVGHRVDPLVTLFVSSVTGYGVLAVVGIAVLQLFGIQTASLVAVLGATSLAIGLALQGTLSNLAAGVMLLLFRPFHIGNDVEVAGKAGKVRSLSLFMTELVAPDNTQILLPNGQVWGTAIINRSAYPGTGEVKVAFPVRAGSVNALADQILKQLREGPSRRATARAVGQCVQGNRRRSCGAPRGIDGQREGESIRCRCGQAARARPCERAAGGGVKSSAPRRPRRSSFGRTTARRAGHARAQPAGGFAARLGLGLRAAGEIHQHAQRLDHGAGAHGGAADRAEAVLAVDDPAVACRGGEVHETDRLAGRSAAGTGNAGDGDGEIDAGTLQRADRHRGCGFLADGAEIRERAGLDAEHRALGVVGIGDEAAINDIRGAGDIGQRAGNEAAGARLGGRDCQLAHPAQIEQRAGEGTCVAAAHDPTRPRAGGWWRSR